jgi:cytochrome P450
MAISFDLLTLSQNIEIYSILSSTAHDPQYFENPDNFNCEHFLDASGAFNKNDAFIHFFHRCAGPSIPFADNRGQVSL